MITFPLPKPLTTEQAATRLWTIRHLLRERALDPVAAETSLALLRKHANPNVARAAEQAAS